MMKNIKGSSLTIATMGLMTAACTTATAENLAQQDVKKDHYTLTSHQDNNPEREWEQEERARELAEHTREVIDETMATIHEAMEQAHETMRDLEINEDKIKKDVKKAVKLAMINAQANLEKAEQELKNFEGQEFKADMDDLREKLKKLAKKQYITKEEMNRILEEVEKDKKEALKDAAKALQEIRTALKELHQEALESKDL